MLTVVGQVMSHARVAAGRHVIRSVTVSAVSTVAEVRHGIDNSCSKHPNGISERRHTARMGGDGWETLKLTECSQSHGAIGLPTDKQVDGWATGALCELYHSQGPSKLQQGGEVEERQGCWRPCEPCTFTNYQEETLESSSARAERRPCTWVWYPYSSTTN